jgi:hypothetical protein
MSVAIYPVCLCYAAAIVILCQKIVVFNSSTVILHKTKMTAIQRGSWTLFAA